MNKSDFEPVDNTPVEIPTRLRLPQSRTDQIRAFIRQELSQRAYAHQHETFEEADDIDPDDEDPMPYTPYELRELEPPAAPSTLSAKPGEGAAQPPAVPAASSEVPPAPSVGGAINGKE